MIYAPYGDSVFVIEQKKDASGKQASSPCSQQFVRLGERRGDFVAVISGLKAGETVVEQRRLQAAQRRWRWW